MQNRATSQELAHAIGDWAVGRGPLFRKLARAIAGAIERGTLDAGSRLPSERVLAKGLIVSRGTAVAAYDALVAEGLIDRRRGSGTYVIGDRLHLPSGREGSALVHRLVDRSAGASDVVDLSISVLHDAEGLPPVSVTSDDAAALGDTGYSPFGLPELRAAVAQHVTRWGLPSTAEQIVITTGAQQAVSIAGACWVRPGDHVVVEDPTYPGALSTFTAMGARLVGVAVDRHGVRPDALREALGTRPALVYLQSTLHSPSGAVLPATRRRQIADLLAAERVPLVEDLALADLAWKEAPAPIASMRAGEASTVVVGSFSKTFWGGLRVGFARAPEALALRLARVKATHDLGSSAISQLMTARLLAAPSVGRFLDHRRSELRERYGVLGDALRRRLPAWRWEEPAGGLSLWVRLPRSDAAAFAQVALRHGVAVAAAEALAVTDDQGDRIRLSFSAPAGELEEGVARLATAWAAFG